MKLATSRAIAGLILLIATSATKADDRPAGSRVTTEPTSTAGKTDTVHYRLIRLPKGRIPADDDLVGTIEVPRAYLKWSERPAGSAETKLGVEIEALYPKMTPLGGFYSAKRPWVTVAIATDGATSDTAISAIIDFLKDKGMKHTHDRDDLCGYAMPEKLPGQQWFVPCNEHASTIALISCGVVCNLQTAFANRLALRIVYPPWLVGESFAIRDAVVRLISSLKPSFAATPVVSERASPGTDAAPPAAATPLHSGGSAATRDEDPNSMRIELLGPEWEDVPKGYFGIIPEKVVGVLQIPRAYAYPDTQTRTSNVPIAFSYPSMEAAADGKSRDTIHAIIVARRARTQPSPYLLLSRSAIREPKLDVGGLCGHVDTQHPGLAGLEFYWPCNETDPVFEVTCGPEFNNRRPCSDYAFLGEGLAVMLSYQIEMLEQRDAIVDGVKKLILPWKRPLP